MTKILKSLTFLLTLFSFLFKAVPTYALGSSPTQPTSEAIFHIPYLSGFTNLADLINVLIQLAFFAAGLFFFFNLVIGGIQWINAGGDPKAMSASRTRLTNAFIGILIVVAAYAITGIVGAVFGISIIKGFVFRSP